jgi:large subunit ribosomal protein L22
MASVGASLSRNVDRESTKSVVRYVRVSAHKARPVLNQIRNLSVARAEEILAFSERSVSEVISNCLNSAIANAGNNNGIPREELFVSECFADEGPTLKRFRPRARGRATSIFKRTCHLTVVVSRYTEEEIESLQAHAELKSHKNNFEAGEELVEEDQSKEAKSKKKKSRSSKEEVLEEETLEEEEVLEEEPEEALEEEEVSEEEVLEEQNEEQNEKEAN